MSAIFYPAVMERGEGGAYAVWFPDWPGVVAAARTQSDAWPRPRGR
jgi:predicted RNase H-like HicB family nuclease